MCLVPAADGDGGQDLAVTADRHELVGAVAEAVDAERPDVDVVLPSGHLRDVGRHARLVGACRGRDRGEQQTAGEHRDRVLDGHPVLLRKMLAAGSYDL
jgi:hypothetical protein